MTVTRRNFLAGSAAAAAAPTLIRPPGPAGSGAAPIGPGPLGITLRINGEEVSVEAEPRSTLLDVLRWRIGLTGPKEVCDRGACGACTVLLDDRPVCSCMTLAVDAVGHEVTTVEGTGTPESPSKVQAAFIQHDAVQCGYCTPGFVMSIEGALRRDPGATPEDLRHAIRGNLCRCGTYTKIFEATERICGGDPQAGHPERNAGPCLEVDKPRVDAPEKIAGTAVFCADVRREGMLFAHFLLCPYGKARLVSADVEAVERLPGVVEVSIETGKDYAYSGAPAGYVCADSREALRDAIAALRPRWEPEAVETDPRALHEEQHGPLPPPVEETTEGARGDAARKALADADVVMERLYTTQLQMHNALEPHGGMVDPTTTPPEGWMSTQGTFTCVDALAQGLEKPARDVAVRCDYVGGGFGAKFGAGREGSLAARLAGRLGRPVRVFNDREAEQLDTGNRPGSMQWMKIGASKEGKLLGGFVYIAGVTGVGRGGNATNPSRYDFGAVVRSYKDVRGPHGAPRAFRAPGHPQGMFAVESMMDELAEGVGVDPVEFRTINETSDVRRAMLKQGAEEIGWARREASGSQKGRLRRGFGCAVADWGSRKGRCAIAMRALPDGTVHVFSGTQDMGQGQRTVLADLAADSLGMDRERIVVHLASSKYPAGPASGGSTTARLTAPAVRDAAAKLLEALGADEDLRGNPAAWQAATRGIAAEGVTVRGEFNDDYWGTGGSECVQFAEVEVDAETGVAVVKRIVALQACGLTVNRLAAENQVIGGVIQGISYALFEDRATDPQLGYQMNANLLDYKIAGALDVPKIDTFLWGMKDGLGVRSLGEPPTIPTSGAIANAVANALGVRVRSLPITPERILAAMEESMRRFEYLVPDSVDEASELCAEGSTVAKAGGVDLLDLMKEGLERPARVVGLHEALDSSVRWRGDVDAGQLQIGAGVKLADLARKVTDLYPALAEAAGETATPQIREMATIGGNLLQRPHCWYFRSRHYPCLKKGGPQCFAQEGLHATHALFNNGGCAVVHASNTAPALIALGASVELQSSAGVRKMLLRDVFTPSSDDAQVETALREDEILTRLFLPPSARGPRSGHYEVRQKQTYDWPLAVAAANLNGDQATLVLGAVASTPLVVEGLGDEIRAWAAAPSRARLQSIAEKAVAGATPLDGNAWRLPLLEAAIKRALMKAHGIPEEQW